MAKLRVFAAAILAATTMAAATPADVSGTWKVVYDADPKTGPKTVGSMILDLKVVGDTVTGTARIGVWPGEAPIEDGKIEGDRITFTATGHLGSTTGIPTCKFDITIQGDEMLVKLSAIKNAGGPLQPGYEYPYRGKRKTE
jgi:hypothetical protein